MNEASKFHLHSVRARKVYWLINQSIGDAVGSQAVPRFCFESDYQGSSIGDFLIITSISVGEFQLSCVVGLECK